METIMPAGVTAIIPTLNEAGAITGIVRGLIQRGAERVIVADGCSSDGTQDLARSAGATVVTEFRRGYGRACLAGVAAAGNAPILLFLDGDGADSLDGAVSVTRRLVDRRLDLVLGTRVTALGQRQAQTSVAAAGNQLCAWWLRTAFQCTLTDFPSMKAISRDAYFRLHPEHLMYGWTAQLIARAARYGLPTSELPILYVRGSGKSKVSGTIAGALRAGRDMLAVIAAESVAAAFFSTAQWLQKLRRRNAAAGGSAL